MTVTAKDLLKRARILLQDHESTRWSLVEMVGWFNDAQREIVLQKPNACSTTTVLPLVVGTLQAVPTTFVSLIRVVRNITDPLNPAAGGKTAYMSQRDVLDATYPDWHFAPAAKRVKCVVYDAADTHAFYTYPPNDGAGHLEVVVSRMPTDIALPAGGEEPLLDIEAYDSPLGLEGIYANAILDYGIYRAYMKDAAVQGNAARATFYLQQFGTALGVKYRAEMMANPNAPQPTQPVAAGPAAAVA